MKILANKTISKSYLLFIMTFCVFVSCDTQKKERQEELEKMRSAAIYIPYERMQCWTTDSVTETLPWNHAKLKLVHYIDSVACSSCYLQKAATNSFLHTMETLSDAEFYNVYIVAPGEKTKKKLESEFKNKLIPQSIFVDTANIFIKENPSIPSKSIYHTFLLDEKDKVILVGNPIVNKKIEKMMLSIVEEKLGRKFTAK